MVLCWKKWLGHIREEKGIGKCRQKKQKHEQSHGLLKWPDGFWHQKWKELLLFTQSLTREMTLAFTLFT